MKFNLDYLRDDEPNWGPVGEIVYKRTYEHNGCGWGNTVKDTVETCYTLQRRHCLAKGLPWSDSKAQHSAKEMYDLIYSFKFLPPGRGLDCGRIELVDAKGGAVLNNCGFTSTKNGTSYDFAWSLKMLGLGVGVGFDTTGKFSIRSPRGEQSWIIEDSLNGWFDAYTCLLDSFLFGDRLPVFSYERIRPKGSPLKTMGGTASGPGPLKQMLDDTKQILSAAEGRILAQQEIADIFLLQGRCIVSGNKRRSAMLGLGTSEDFISMKTPENKDHPFRWAGNLSSIEYDRKTVDAIVNGNELGIFFLENARKYGRMGDANFSDANAMGTNPCAEQTLHDKELCCLVETFPSLHTSYYEYQKTLKYAYLYAKSVTLAKTHDHNTNLIIEKNRRIGTSMTGVVEAVDKFAYSDFFRKFCDKGYNYTRSLDDRYSEWLMVNRSIKVTSVKPSGTVSKLPGVSSGVHFPHSKYYLQGIRFSSNSPYLPALRSAGYELINLHPKEPNTTLVYFPVKSRARRFKKDVPMLEQLDLVAQMQKYWADNQVSVTITFTEKEREAIPRAIEAFKDRLKAVTFYPLETKRFENAPIVEVTEDEYNERISKLTKLSLPSIREEEDKFCNGEICESQTNN